MNIQLLTRTANTLGRIGRARASRRWHGPWTLAVPVVFSIAGLIGSTSALTARGTNLRTETRLSTADLIAQQQRLVAREANTVAKLRADVDQSARQAAPLGSALSEINRESQRVAPLAGLTAVRGPALEVQLNDAVPGGALPDDIEPDDLVVHQQDVQAVVNALWAAGAEGMMLMDQRVIATSAVRCVGNVLILQGKLYSPPYKITAIGDISAMKAGLLSSPEVGTYRDYADTLGLGYLVRSVGSREFPAYVGATGLQYAKVTGD